MLGVRLSLERSHLLASDLVDGIMGESLHVKAIEDYGSLRCVRLNGFDVALGHVQRDELELGGALRTELLEEGAERLGAAPALRPDDPSECVIDHDGDVLLSLSIRELVDTDGGETVEQIRWPHASSDPRDDGPHGAPRDSHQLRYGGLI